MSWGVLDLPLLVPRVCAWVLLFGVALFDALKHRHVKRRGSQLHRGLVAVVFAYVVQELLLLSFAILYRQKAPKARAVCASWIFFIDLADTAMIVRFPFSLVAQIVCCCSPAQFALRKLQK